MLEAVADICVTEECLLNAMDDMNQNNPAATFEKQMLTKISNVSSDDEIFGLINESVKNTNDTAVSVNVRHVFQLDKPAQQLAYSPFQRKLHNKHLLWCGSRHTSVLSNMRDGLRVHPNEAPTAGLMFGKGIYLTDSFAKAISQCQLQSKSEEPKIGLVFLAEAALGEMHKAF